MISKFEIHKKKEIFVKFTMRGITGFFGKSGTGKSKIIGCFEEMRDFMKRQDKFPENDTFNNGQLELRVHGENTKLFVERSLQRFYDETRHAFLEQFVAMPTEQDIAKCDVPAFPDFVTDRMAELFGSPDRSTKPFNPWRWHDCPDSKKPFLALGNLLLYKLLKAGDVLVLDNVGDCMHPDDQVRFAELLVLLHKTAHIQLVLASNVIDFWQAIRLSSLKYEVTNRIDMYKTKLHGGKVAVRRVQDNDWDYVFNLFLDSVNLLEELQKKYVWDAYPEPTEAKIDRTNYMQNTVGKFKSVPAGWAKGLIDNIEGPVELGGKTWRLDHIDADVPGTWSGYWVSDDNEHLIRVSDRWSFFSKVDHKQTGVKKVGNLDTCTWSLKTRPHCIKFGDLMVAAGYIRFDKMKWKTP